jgi:hypothetical protein
MPPILPFDPAAKPAFTLTPYRRIDFRKLGRKKVITRAEVDASGGREPDPALYEFNFAWQCWVLKDD